MALPPGPQLLIGGSSLNLKVDESLTDAGIPGIIGTVTYSFDFLGWKEFEHLVQALASKVIGPRVSSFGAGADGGREAIWDGEAASLGALPDWNGYGVVQAKYSEFPEKPAANLEWLKKAILKELRDWAKEGSNRSTKPQFILFASNVRLSPAPGGGKDAIKTIIADEIYALNLPILDFRVWDYDDLSRLLDDAADIRKRYAAFITAGDVLSQILDLETSRDRGIARALRSAAGRSLMEDAHIGLTQAGAMDDTRVTIADVFVDLPFGGRDFQWEQAAHDGDAESIAWRRENDRGRPGSAGAAGFIIESLNSSRPPGADPGRPLHTVLVGGPGQGKSTVTQWLAQLYRVSFLEGSELENNVELSPLISEVTARAAEIGMPVLRSRRWPARVVLTEFADFIASNESASLLHFIAKQVNDGSAVGVDPHDLLSWLERYPWVLLIDGLDEVPASSNRDQVVRAIKDLEAGSATEAD